MQLLNVYARFVAALAESAQVSIQKPELASTPIAVHVSPPYGASKPIGEAFVSYAIEMSHFPDLAGNITHPNLFFRNLLDNLGSVNGGNVRPYVRVGGNTGDYAVFNASLRDRPTALAFDRARTVHYPTAVQVGPSYFASYAALPGVRFVPQLNMAYAWGRSRARETVGLLCAALRAAGGDGGSGGDGGGDGLLWWEFGNEPDLFPTAYQRWVRRPEHWSGEIYGRQWLEGTRELRRVMEEEEREACGPFLGDDRHGFWGLSFFTTNGLGLLDAVEAMEAGMGAEGTVKQLSFHNYLSDARATWESGVTLSNTLLDHQKTVHQTQHLVDKMHELDRYGLPFVLGETASFLNDDGVHGLSNTFAAGLWNLNYALWCASVNISRIHYQQGQFFRYGSFQAATTEDLVVGAEIGTKPAYYGDMAASFALANAKGSKPLRIVNIPLTSRRESAYAIYVGDSLARIAIINLRQFNYSDPKYPSPRPRIAHSYEMQFDSTTDSQSSSSHRRFAVRRLIANGSDALSGVTWDGWSYNWDLDEGKPVRLENVTVRETVKMDANGKVRVVLEDSSAVILEAI